MAKKKTQSKKHPRKLWENYEVKGEELVRKNKFSPKSKGDFMAEHKDRRSCGRTGYMEKKL